MDLTDRKSKILLSVVNNYIETGEPVGSKAIAEEIGVSSATIRNEMAELIHLGLLEQPYTSAGRIPSQKGYRKYVDSMQQGQTLSEEDKAFFDASLMENAYDEERLLIGVSRILATYSKYVSIVSTPGGSSSRVKGVQFVQISRRTAMLILMSSTGAVNNRIFHCDYDLTSEIMRMFFRVFNEKLNGMQISDITVAFIQSMAASLGELSILSASPLMALLEVAQETSTVELLIHGQMNLLVYPEMEYSGVRAVINFLDDKEAVGRLLAKRIKKITVLIGYETDRQELKETSVAMTRYFTNSQDTGTIAVIGPMRMHYKKIFAVLNYLSEQVGAMLTTLTKEE